MAITNTITNMIQKAVTLDGQWLEKGELLLDPFNC